MSVPMSNFRGARFWKLVGAAVAAPMVGAELACYAGYHDQGTAYVLVAATVFWLAVAVNRFAASRTEN